MLFTGIISILTLALIIAVYRETRGTSTQSALIGWLLSVVLVLTVLALDSPDQLKHLSGVIELVALSFIFLFSAELKRALSNLDIRPRRKVRITEDQKDNARELCREVASAAESLSKKREGALIVVEQRADLSEFLTGGIVINARVKASLLHAIFCHNGNDFHDGAVVIRGGLMWQAKAFLPMPHSVRLSQKYGTRHLAAVGITDQTDALVVVVSEERGTISIVYAGQITELSDRFALERALEAHLI